MSETKKIDTLISGGEATAGPPLGPILGPLGVNVLQIVNKINELTKDYAGMKVPVKISVNVSSKEFDVKVGTPTVAALIVRELGISKGSGTPNTEKVGDLSMEQTLKIAQLKRHQLLAGSSRAAVKEILGCCVSMGVTVDGKDPKTVLSEIDEGAHTELLKEEPLT